MEPRTIEILSDCPFCERNWLQKSKPTPAAMAVAVALLTTEKARHVRQTHPQEDGGEPSPERLMGDVMVRLECELCPRSYSSMAQPTADDLDRAAGVVAWLMAEHVKADHPAPTLEDAIVDRVYAKIACPFCDREFVQSCEAVPARLAQTIADLSCMRAAHVAEEHRGEHFEPGLADSVMLSYGCPFCKRDIGQDSGTRPEELAGTMGDLIQMAGEHFETDHKDREVPPDPIGTVGTLPSTEELLETAQPIPVTPDLDDDWSQVMVEETPPEPLTVEALQDWDVPLAEEPSELLEDTVSPLYFGDIQDIQIAEDERAKLETLMRQEAALQARRVRCEHVKTLAVEHFVKSFDLDRREVETTLRIIDPGNPAQDGYVVGFLDLEEMEEIEVKLWAKWDKTDPAKPILKMMEAKTKAIFSVGRWGTRILGEALVYAAETYQARQEYEAQEALETISWNEHNMAQEETDHQKVQVVAEALAKYPILLPVLELVIEHIRAVDKLQAEVAELDDEAGSTISRLESKLQDSRDEITRKTTDLQYLHMDLEEAKERGDRS